MTVRVLRGACGRCSEQLSVWALAFLADRQQCCEDLGGEVQKLQGNALLST